MQQGWIKLHRQSIESPVFQSSNLWHVWTWCLMKASHAESKFLWNGKEEILFPGQFISGRIKGGAECNMNPSTFWKQIHTLETLEQIASQCNNRFTVFTVINWAKYQIEEKSVTAKEQPSNNQVTTKEQPSNTFKNVKNERMKEKTLKGFLPESDEYKIAEYLYKQILNHLPTLKPPNLQQWATDADRLLRIDKRDKHEVALVIKWAQSDPFWKTNILSVSKLRTKYDTLNAKRLNHAITPNLVTFKKRNGYAGFDRSKYPTLAGVSEDGIEPPVV